MKPIMLFAVAALTLTGCSRPATDPGGNAIATDAGATMNDAIRTVDEATATAFGDAGKSLDRRTSPTVPAPDNAAAP